MKVIGLTGGIASGKSTVSKLLMEAGFPVVDADKVAREVVALGTPALQEISALFGPEILTEEGTLNRPALGAIVFKDNQARQKLNAIVHPKVRESMALAMMKIAEENHPLAFMDIPLLYEARNPDDFDKIVVVWVDINTQIQRLMKRDACSRSAALARIGSQMDLNEKKERADYVIDNCQTPEETVRQTQETIDSLLNHSIV